MTTSSDNGFGELISEEKIQDFKAAFAQFDIDGDNTIATKDVAPIIRNLGYNPTEAELRTITSELDPDASGVVELPEFLNVMERKAAELEDVSEDDLRDAFRLFDRDGNGSISAEELTFALATVGEKMSDDEISDMMRDFDIDADGKISYEEFAKMMLSRP